jgi:cysteine-rich repeat protein
LNCEIDENSHKYDNKEVKRRLGAIDVSQSLITGIPSSAEAFQTYTITLVAKDSSGDDVGTGGSTLIVEIRNKCTISGVIWVTDTSAKLPLSASIVGDMTDHGNGTYTFDFSINQSGEVSILVIDASSKGVSGEYYRTTNLSGSIAVSNTSSDLNLNWGLDGLPGQNDNWSAKFTTYIRPPYSGTYSINVAQDNWVSFFWDGVLRINKFGMHDVWDDNFAVTLTAGQLYPIEINFVEFDGYAYVIVSWSGPNTPFQVIPSSACFLPTFSALQPYQVTVSCPTGYSGTNSSSPYLWKEICGDGLRIGAEIWDDGNTNDNDGCNGNWGIVESNFICVGGAVTSPDVCTPWEVGYHPNGFPTPFQCIETWGDGRRIGIEVWDDGNTADGDGCNSDWRTVSPNYIWVGGSFTSADTCSECTTGYKPNSNNPPDRCITIWGDGRKIDEWWDDGNTENGDGCNDECVPESDWACSGGDFNTPDIWIKWASGYSNNEDYSHWITRPFSRTAQVTRALAAFAMLSGMSLSAMTALASSSASSSSSFGMMNQLQMIIVLPLLGSDIPEKVMDFIWVMCQERLLGS